MEYLIALVSVVVLTIIGSMLLNKLHPACSSMDFESNDAYFKYLERRDRFFQEEHTVLAAINTVIAVGLASWFAGTAATVMLPTLAFAFATFATWSLLRFAFRRPDQMVRWDNVDMAKLGIALAVGIAVGVTVCVALSLSVSGLWSVPIFAFAWLLLFPL